MFALAVLARSGLLTDPACGSYYPEASTSGSGGAGGSSAGGSNAGGSNAGGSNAGGSNAGGSAGHGGAGGSGPAEGDCGCRAAGAGPVSASGMMAVALAALLLARRRREPLKK